MVSNGDLRSLHRLLVLCRVIDIVINSRRHTHQLVERIHRLAETPLRRTVRIPPLRAVSSQFLSLQERGRKLRLACESLAAMAGPRADKIRNTDRCGLHRNNAGIVLVCVYAMS